MSTSQQPTAQPDMTVGRNRNVKNLPIGPEGREWSHGLCDCFSDCSTCCMAWLCPCAVYSFVKRRYESLSQSDAPDPTRGGPFFSRDCLFFGAIQVCCHAGFILDIRLRSDIRHRYNISGSGLTDCAAAFLLPCALTQESRELELEEQAYGGVKA